MKKVKINNIEYELIKNYKDGFDESAVSELITDYYDSFTGLYLDKKMLDYKEY